MLEQFRKKNTPEKLVWLIGAVIGAAIILTVVSKIPSLFKPKSYVGEIFGKKITAEAFQKVYRHNLTLTKFRYGRMFEDVEPLLNLDTQTWDQLILLREAKNHKIKVSDKEVINAIAQYKIFFRKNKFNDLLYKQIIRTSLQSEIKNFEEAIRESLITDQLRAKITSPITFSMPQIREEYQKQNTKIEVTYVQILASDYEKEILLTDKEMHGYYEQHKYDFFVPPTVKVEYIRADYPKGAGVQKRVETKFKAKAIIKEYPENPDFKALAKKFKFSVHESGYFHRKQLDFPLGNTESGKGLKIKESYTLLKNLFTLEVGQVVGPAEWEKGYLVLKLKEKRPSYIPDFAEAKEKIVSILTRKKSGDMAEIKAREYLTKIQKKQDFVESLKSLGLTAEQTALLPQRQILFILGIQKKSRDTLFALTTQNPLSGLASTTKGYAILHLDELIPADMSAFGKNSRSFAERMMEEKKDEAYGAFLEDLHKKANLKKFLLNNTHSIK